MFPQNQNINKNFKITKKIQYIGYELKNNQNFWRKNKLTSYL